MKLPRNQKGFTLIELVMVIVILGILAAVAVPKFSDVSNQAKAASEAGVAGGVRAGITTVYMTRVMAFATGEGDTTGGWRYPPKLDAWINAGWNTTVGFFDSVLAQGGVQDGIWYKASQHSYEGPATGEYMYYPEGSSPQAPGSFLKENTQAITPVTPKTPAS